MSFSGEISNAIGEAFDVPFDVRSGFDNGNRWVSIKPENSRKEFFSVDLRIQNSSRLKVTIKPQAYAKQMLVSMSKASSEKKDNFCAYVKQMKQERAKVSVKINESPIDFSETVEWPSNWTKFSVDIELFPIAEDPLNSEESKIAIRHWAIYSVGLMLSLLELVEVEPALEEHTGVQGEMEGRSTTVQSKRYERSKLNRALCLEANGFDCVACGFNFERYYGDIGKNFIHVHHITPVSQMGEGYAVDPVRDLVPLCPNCHAMVHRTDPPISVDQLKRIINSSYSTNED